MFGLRKMLASLAPVVVVALATPLFAQNMEISSEVASATGSINRGDFNNDGVQDVVFCAGSGFGVAFGKPNGQLQPPVYTNGNSCSGLTVADFNNDGKPDVAITSSYYQVTDVYLNNGNGTFTLSQELTSGGFDVNAGDFNNDGNMDLAVATSVNNQLNLYPGLGTGHFGTQVTITTTPAQILKVRVADFDRDGKTDIVLSGNQLSNNVEVLFNNGGWNFTHKIIGGSNAYLINPLDLNLDGYTDLLLGHSENCVSNPKNTLCDYFFDTYLSSGGTRNFNKTNTVAVNDPLGGLRDATAADVNGDGINDIVGVWKPGIWSVGVWRGQPNGTYSAPTNYELGGSETTISIVQSDANRDGRPDFTVTNAGDFNHGLARLLNAVPRATCATDTGIGITGCMPTGFTYSLPKVRFLANAHDTRAAVTKFQLFVDNNLKYSAAGGHMDVTLNPVASGTHQVVFKAFNANGKSFLSPRTITVSPAATPLVTCDTPINTARICLPAATTSGSGPLQVLAAGYPPNTPTAVKLYLDGSLIYSASTLQNYVQTTHTLTSGTHTFLIKVWDANGHLVQASKTVTSH